MEEKKENIKDILARYNKTKFEISNLEMRKKILLDDYDTSITPSYSGMPSGSGGTSDKVFDTVAKKQSDLEKIDKQLEAKNKFVKVVDDLIANLGYKQQKVVVKRAIQNKDFITICREMNEDNIFNAKYCREIFANSCKSMQDILDSLNIEF